jgi:hypothetical protein
MSMRKDVHSTALFRKVRPPTSTNSPTLPPGLFYCSSGSLHGLFVVSLCCSVPHMSTVCDFGSDIATAAVSMSGG